MSNLIISTGDASDADGFLSVALYAKTNADLLFIMNLPAVYNENYGTQTFEQLKKEVTGEFPNKATQFAKKTIKEDGLGFEFHYDDILNKRRQLLNLCYNIVKNIWTENGGKVDKLFFYYKDGSKYIVNDINPFGFILEDELEVYEGVLGGNHNNLIDAGDEPCNRLPVPQYANIYMDGNGSFAFYKYKYIKKFIDTNISQIKALSLMAGVETEEDPLTLIPGIFLNRLQYATMNQVYSPEGFYNFMTSVKSVKPTIPVYVTTNNEVNKNASYHIDVRWGTAIEKNKIEIYNSIKRHLSIDDVNEQSLLEKSMKKIHEMFHNTNTTLGRVIEKYYGRLKKSDKRKLFDVVSSLQLIQCMAIPMKTTSTSNPPEFPSINNEKGSMLIDNIFGIAKTKQDKTQGTMKLDANEEVREQERLDFPIIFTRLGTISNFEKLVKARMVQQGGNSLIHRLFNKYSKL